MSATPNNIADPAVPTSRNAGAGVRRFGALLWRRRWVVLLVFALVANAVAAGLVLAPREYTANARVAATLKADLAPAPGTYTALLGTLADVASSRPVLDAVASQVPDTSSADLQHRVHGTVLPGTVIVQVSVTDGDAARAAKIANLIVNQIQASDPSNGAFEFKLTEGAIPPDHASSPNIPLLAAIGGLLALVIAAIAAAIADRSFRTVADPDELGQVSGTAVLGVIPRPSEPDGIPAGDVDADEFQALRALRIAVEFASAEDPTRLLVVASATQDPWAGWLEVNIAVALAEVGHRVLVVNADRDRRVHPAIDAPGEMGLYDVLGGVCDLDEAIRPGPRAGVDVLPLGHAHIAAPSLLEMRFRGLLDDTEEEYDVVVVHAAAVSASEDARIMAIHGAMLLSVVTGRANPRHVRRAAEHLQMIRLRVLGTVLIGAKSVHRRRRPARLRPSVISNVPEVAMASDPVDSAESNELVGRS